jgi:hypothetical protein
MNTIETRSIQKCFSAVFATDSLGAGADEQARRYVLVPRGV